MSERDLAVVVLGASGVTGRETAAYLAERAAAAGVPWAVAGRDPAKIERVLGEIGVEAPETIRADVGYAGSLTALARRARVVLDLVGPYTLYGKPVIDACIGNGAHYVDLTGEIPFVRRTIAESHEAAREAGVKVIQVCGFEALPPDLAVLLAAEAARERHGERLAAADVVIETEGPAGVPGLGDLISGGTMQSMAEAVGGPEGAAVTDSGALIEDPAEAAAVRRVSPIAIAPRSGPRGEVVGPMAPAAFINPAVIHRTASLLAAERGESPAPFRYREGMAVLDSIPTRPARYAVAGLLAGTQAAVGAIARARPGIRRPAADLMRKAFPDSGFGPRGPALAEWRWRLRVDARTSGGREITVDLEADGHPGYLTSARMLGEAGLLLAEDGATPDRAGCLTPAIALGSASAPRFAASGARFAVSS